MKESPRARKMRFRKWSEKHVLPYIVQPSMGDGCTMCPDGLVLRSGYVSFVPFCEEHDRAYAAGGDEQLRRDWDHRLCLRIRTAGAPRPFVWAMRAALRIFGPLHWIYLD